MLVFGAVVALIVFGMEVQIKQRHRTIAQAHEHKTTRHIHHTNRWHSILGDYR